eukprot:GFUD01030314.1.p2 GENE.GFUD01030314.1~~GFUD01030314.1.p2  ORF type:complete len:107 (+),score=11.85 GFUD01030314.1:179-499(+)
MAMLGDLNLSESGLGEDGVEAVVEGREAEDLSEQTEASELTLVMLIILELDFMGKIGAGGNGIIVDLHDNGDISTEEVGRDDDTTAGLVDSTKEDSVNLSRKDALV